VEPVLLGWLESGAITWSDARIEIRNRGELSRCCTPAVPG
jgi:hypothetical protein